MESTHHPLLPTSHQCEGEPNGRKRWHNGAMDNPAPRRRRRMALRWFIAIATVVALVVVGFTAWASTPMRGERDAAIEVWTNPAVSVTSTSRSIVLAPTAAGAAAIDTGLVFIPGARVDPYAYMFVLSGIVEEAGVTVVITKPTLNLAFFDTRALSDFTADAPQVTEWFVGGHSLGGVRSCMLAEPDTSADATEPVVAGLVLFASYCATDLSDSDLTVLSLSGSNDLLSTPEKIADAAGLLPPGTAFVEIEGANHARFGNYGEQSGDGVAEISSREMRAVLTRELEAFLAGTP